MAPELEQEIRHLRLRLHVIGLERNGRLEVRNRVFPTRLLEQDGSENHVRLGIVRVDRDRFGRLRQRFLGLTELQKGPRQVATGLSILRIGRGGLLEVRAARPPAAVIPAGTARCSQQFRYCRDRVD